MTILFAPVLSYSLFRHAYAAPHSSSAVALPELDFRWHRMHGDAYFDVIRHYRCLDDGLVGRIRYGTRAVL